MGMWNSGPFDSDGGLDALGFLVDKVDPNGAISDWTAVNPADIDQDVVLAAVRGAFVSGRRSAWAEQEVYAVAGLVAAALMGASSTGHTNLTATADGDALPPWSENSCGYVNLLTYGTATHLIPDALAAVKWLQGRKDWLGLTFVGPGVKDMQNNLTPISAYLDNIRLILTNHDLWQERHEDS